jgi:vacuolar-type H+-ATPase subunit E/Vma4
MKALHKQLIREARSAAVRRHTQTVRELEDIIEDLSAKYDTSNEPGAEELKSAMNIADTGRRLQIIHENMLAVISELESIVEKTATE